MKIIKPVILCLFFIAGISLVSCKSTKKAEITDNAEIEAPEAEDLAEEQEEIVEDTTEEIDNISSSEKKNYTGWINTSKKKVEVKDGIIKLVANPKRGTINLSVLSYMGKYIPVLSTMNESTNSYYSLKVNKKTYKLLTDNNVKPMVKTNDDKTGIKILYHIEGVADVEVDYDIFASAKNVEKDMIKVTATVTNISGKKADFALKSLIDTVLGEATPVHFYTSNNIPVTGEVMYRTMQNEKWFLSQNTEAKMQFLFYDGDISKIETVALANYSTLEEKGWEPDMLSARVFDTVLAYNNSAVSVSWPLINLEPENSVSYVYYLAFANGYEKVNGYEYIQSITKQEPEKINISDLTGALDLEKTDPVAPIVVPATVTPVVTEPENNTPAVTITSEQLSTEYIQNLLDRIAALEENDPTLNRDEIQRLSAELDEIMKLLRQ